MEARRARKQTFPDNRSDSMRSPGLLTIQILPRSSNCRNRLRCIIKCGSLPL